MSTKKQLEKKAVKINAKKENFFRLDSILDTPIWFILPYWKFILPLFKKDLFSFLF